MKARRTLIAHSCHAFTHLKKNVHGLFAAVLHIISERAFNDLFLDEER